MRLQFGSFTLPAASLEVFDIVIVLVLAPLMEHGIYPLLERVGIKVTGPAAHRCGLPVISSVNVCGWTR